MNFLNVTFQQFTYLIEKNKCPLYNIHASGVFIIIIFCGFAIQKWGPSQNTLFGPTPSLPLLSILYIQQNIYFLLFQGKVRLKQFHGQALRLEQARGPSAVARMGLHFQQFSTKLVYIQGQVRLKHFLGLALHGKDRRGGRALRAGRATGPSAAARTGQRAGCYGHMVNYIHVLHIRSM